MFELIIHLLRPVTIRCKNNNIITSIITIIKVGQINDIFELNQVELTKFVVFN